MRRFPLTALLALIGVGLLTGTASAQTKIVYAGTPTADIDRFTKLGVDTVNDFFQHKVTIAAGDSISFHTTGFHTVTFRGKAGFPSFITADAKKKVAHVKDAGGLPFWFNGLPTVGFNAAAAIPTTAKTYDGSAFANSGVPANGPTKPFVLKFTKAGTYRYVCLVHPGMTGVVKVLPAGAATPSKAADAKALRAQAAADYTIAKRLARTKVRVNVIQAGAAGKGGVEIYRLFAGRHTYRAGTVLTTEMSRGTYEIHTVTTGPKAYLAKLVLGGPTVDQRAIYPSQPYARTASLTKKLHGDGFWNSGGLDDLKATKTLPFSTKVKLGGAGTYRFICLVHPDMTTTIKVVR